MIIDLILDRRDGCRYNAREFYGEVLDYREDVPDASDAITRAMDAGDEEGTRRALAYYVLDYGYPAEIAAWCIGQTWLND